MIMPQWGSVANALTQILEVIEECPEIDKLPSDYETACDLLIYIDSRIYKIYTICREAQERKQAKI